MTQRSVASLTDTAWPDVVLAQYFEYCDGAWKGDEGNGCFIFIYLYEQAEDINFFHFKPGTFT